MTLKEVELRVTSLEKKLSSLMSGASASTTLNSWIDRVHGTFQDDATYRQAAKLGRQWRKAQRLRGATAQRRTRKA